MKWIIQGESIPFVSSMLRPINQARKSVMKLARYVKKARSKSEGGTLQASKRILPDNFDLSIRFGTGLMARLAKRHAMDLQPFQKPLPQDFKYVIYYCYAVRLGAPLTPANCCFKGNLQRFEF